MEQPYRECFPELTDQTIKLAEEAMKGMLVLPGTGPELYFVGNPPKWDRKSGKMITNIPFI